jgi:hypothetical protein
MVIGTLAYVAILISLGILAFDWAGGQMGFWIPTSISRLVTGLAGGVAFGIFTHAYRSNMYDSSGIKRYKFTTLKFGLLISYSLLVCLALVKLSSWVVLSSVLLLNVTINAIIIMHNIINVTRSQLWRRVEANNLEKGAIS